ncbi:MAG: energy transducer TonB [Saprospiraceae bacterium]
MENNQLLKYVMDDMVFQDRNKSYGAYLLRRIYDRNMNKAIIYGSIFFLLLVSMPMILKVVKGLIPEKDALILKEVNLTEPPPLDPNKPPPPPPPKIDPPPIKDQIKFVPPKVKKDEEVKEEEPPPPTIEEIKDKDISNETRKGEEGGVDASLIEPPPVVEEKKEEEVFKYVEQMPEFPDGAKAMYDYIHDKLKYPAIARENDIQGTVVVQFVVTSSGDITKVSVARGIGGGCDEEAIRVVRSMPNWRPGKHNGKSVPVSFTLPIKFKLEG